MEQWLRKLLKFNKLTSLFSSFVANNKIAIHILVQR